MIYRWLIALSIPFLLPLSAAPQCPSGKEKIHTDSICGLRIGMKPDEVLAIMQRPPDAGQEQGDEIVSAWKLPKGDILTVRFRKKRYVGMLGLGFHPTLMARDLELPSAAEEQFAGRRPPTHTLTGGPEHASDPRRNLEYRRDETQNGEKIIWYREVKDPGGYTFEVGFESASRLRLGERFFQNVVASKYITVRKPDLEKLDAAMSAAPNKPPANPGTPHDD